MRLDAVPPKPIPPSFSGTEPAPAGVFPPEPIGAIAEALPRVPVAMRTWCLAVCVVWSLLGLGERCRVDPRLISPSTTLTTYWDALRAGDDGTVEDCFVAGKHDLPYPGQLWFLPPTDEFALTGFRSLPVMSGRVMVTYEVRYRAEGSNQEQVFRTGNELVRERGEWRIARPIGEASMPEWKPIRRTVDS